VYWFALRTSASGCIVGRNSPLFRRLADIWAGAGNSCIAVTDESWIQPRAFLAPVDN